MQRREIERQEKRLAAATYAQSPCQAFRVEPPGSQVESWIDLRPGPAGQGFLREWLTCEAQRRLREVGLSEREPGVWSLALGFGEHGWVSYTLRTMGVSTWSAAVFPLAESTRQWPEGILLDPLEQDYVLNVETDLVGIVLPVNGWTVLCFIYCEYSEVELEPLAEKLLNGSLSQTDYLSDPSPLVGLPRPALTLEFPAEVPPDPIQFIPPQPNITLQEVVEGAPRLFKEHWILRLLNPPAKEKHHE